MKQVDPALIVRAREVSKASRDRFKPVKGGLRPTKPRELWQIDHSLVDVIRVDELERRPIGRPWLTLVIDVATRMIAGFYLTMDPPCATSTALAISHSVLPKSGPCLESDESWPVEGLPDAIHLDNAKEFHSQALELRFGQLNLFTAGWVFCDPYASSADPFREPIVSASSSECSSKRVNASTLQVDDPLKPNSERIFADGEMAERIRRHPWETTAIGATDRSWLQRHRGQPDHGQGHPPQPTRRDRRADPRRQSSVVLYRLTAANDLGLTDTVPTRIGELTDGRMRPITFATLLLIFKLPRRAASAGPATPRCAFCRRSIRCATCFRPTTEPAQAPHLHSQRPDPGLAIQDDCAEVCRPCRSGCE